MWNKKVDTIPIMQNAEVLSENGVMYIEIDGELLVQVPTMFQFIKDLLYLMNCINNNSIASYAHNRLKYLESKF